MDPAGDAARLTALLAWVEAVARRPAYFSTSAKNARIASQERRSAAAW